MEGILTFHLISIKYGTLFLLPENVNLYVYIRNDENIPALKFKPRLKLKKKKKEFFLMFKK